VEPKILTFGFTFFQIYFWVYLFPNLLLEKVEQKIIFAPRCPKGLCFGSTFSKG